MNLMFYPQGVLSMRKDKDNQLFSFFFSLPNFFNEFVLDSIGHYNMVIQRENLKFFKKIIDKNMKKPAELTSYFCDDYDHKCYVMSEEELKEYNMAQINEIKKFKHTLEKHDNREYSMEEVISIWAEKCSAKFRKYWHLKRYTDLT